MANTLLKDKEFNILVRQTVIGAIRDIFNDPDYGLPLASRAVKRLKKSIKSKKAGRVKGLEAILEKYSEQHDKVAD